jgi:hypothetical protein
MVIENVGDGPAGDIGRPAGSERNDDRDRSRRIILGLRASDSGCHQENRRCHQCLAIYRLADIMMIVTIGRFRRQASRAGLARLFTGFLADNW